MKHYLICLYILFLYFTWHSLPAEAQHFYNLTIHNGLSQPSVMAIAQDGLGRMWFGTYEGLNMYDGERIVSFKGHVDNGNGRKLWIGNRVLSIVTGKEGNLYFISDKDLYKYDIRAASFSRITTGRRTTALYSDGTTVWYIWQNELYKMDYKRKSFVKVRQLPALPCNALLVKGETVYLGTTNGLYVMGLSSSMPVKTMLKNEEVFRLFMSSRNELWIGTRMQGLFRYANGLLKKVPSSSDGSNGTYDLQIRQIMEDRSGNIWFGTFRGLQKFDYRKNAYSLVQIPVYAGGLTHPSIFSLFQDRQGTIWVGSYFGGVNYFSPGNDAGILHYDYQTDNIPNLYYSYIGEMTKDKHGNLWICTDGGGVSCVDANWNLLHLFTSGHLNSILHNNVKSLAYDSRNDALYIGTYLGGLSRYDIATNHFTHYMKTGNETTGNPGNIITRLKFWNGRLYIASRNGIWELDPASNHFRTLIPKKTDFCEHFDIDPQGNLYAVYDTGILKVSLSTGRVTMVLPFRNRELQSNVSDLLATRDGLFICTFGNGLLYYNKADSQVTAFRKSNSELPTDYCYKITRTHDGRFVLTSDEGILLFNPSDRCFNTLIKKDNLPNGEIIAGCGIYVDDHDRIYVGDTHGVTCLGGSKDVYDDKKNMLYFSSLLINNQTIVPSSKGKILSEAFPFTKKLNLNYNQNNLIVRFGNSDYIHSESRQGFEYKLDGFDKGWTFTTIPEARYTNLAPGHYKLLVRVAHQAEMQPVVLEITIATPWFNSIPAWIVYVALFLGAVSYYLHNKKSKLLLAASLEKERFEKQQTEKLNQSKLQFFTNVSHEFRTPLTLIVSHIDMLLQTANLQPQVYSSILKVKRNTQQMLRLVSELLDFRKITQNYFTIELSNQDFSKFLKEVYLSFKDYATQKGIDYSFQSRPECIVCWFDVKQLEKVFYNILSNAFKYTPEQGYIHVSVVLENRQLVVQVQDSGCGIPEKELQRIFERFYQANNRKGVEQTPGTGIGLSLSLAIVERHHGIISVKSDVGKGSLFTITLPADKLAYEGDKQVRFVDEVQQTVSVDTLDEDMLNVSENVPEPDNNVLLAESDYKTSDRMLSVLLVEDNVELLGVLRNLFSPYYKVYTATNGRKGLDVAFEYKPDLIVSDIMMPEMLGTEMCLQIKNNIDLCHIPVILLTALNTTNQHIEGFNRGADDYISKPFNSQLLLARANNLVRNRLLIRHQLNKKPFSEIDLTSINPLDQEMLKKTSRIMEKHLADEAFDIPTLCREIGMGRSLLYSKFKALTGMTPNAFLLNFRLKSAAALLQKYPDLPIAEVCVRCGFGNPDYFRRCFKAQYNCTPQQYRREQRKE